MAETNYGKDIAMVIGGGIVDIDATFRMVSGAELMAQICVKRCYCRKGQLLSDPNDNTIFAPDFINQGIAANQSGLAIVKTRIQSAILGDPRVFTCIATPSFDTTTRTLTVPVSGNGSQGPFALTLKITELTVEALRP